MRVIPKLAERAEGPHRRSTATASDDASAVDRPSLLSCVTEFAVVRSRGALRQPRDDTRRWCGPSTINNWVL